MIHHQCQPTCAECVRDVAQARALARAQLLPRLNPTVRVTRITHPKEAIREAAA